MTSFYTTRPMGRRRSRCHRLSSQRLQRKKHRKQLLLLMKGCLGKQPQQWLSGLDSWCVGSGDDDVEVVRTRSKWSAALFFFGLSIGYL